MKEIWKGVIGHEKTYQVSNLGNVRSLNYRNTGKTKNLVPKVNNCGRLWVELDKKPLLVHRLVAMAFIPNPDELPEINHKDENPKNNSVENLEWCTGEYNKKTYQENHKGIGRKRTLLRPVNQIDSEGRIVKKWNCLREIQCETGMNQWSITQCCQGIRKTAYGFKWQYAI